MWKDEKQADEEDIGKYEAELEAYAVRKRRRMRMQLLTVAVVWLAFYVSWILCCLL